jgi:hypothetical protein
MTFVYDQLTNSSDMSYLWPEMTNALNDLSKKRRKSAKIAASDMKGSDARAILIYCDSAAPDEAELGTNWTSKVFKTTSGSEEAYQALYQECVNFLNGNLLSDVEKYYAQISFTNASSNDGFLALFWRELER